MGIQVRDAPKGSSQFVKTSALICTLILKPWASLEQILRQKSLSQNYSNQNLIFTI